MALTPLGMSLMMAQAPQAQPRPGTVGPTDVLGAYNLSSQVANQQYLAKLQQQNALWGGLAGIGSAGIIGTPGLYKLYQASQAANAPVSLSGTSGAAAAAPSDALALAPEEAVGGATSYAPEAIGPSLSSWLAAPDAAAGGAAAAGAGTVAADVGAESALGAAAPAIAGGTSLADILPFLFAAA
jgi:hypothetical protein